MEIDIVAAIAPLLALGILIERLLEVGFLVVEGVWITNPDEPKYVRLKAIFTFLAGILLGVVIASQAQLNFFPTLPSPNGGVIAIGVIGGAISPYAHQFIELLTKGQKHLVPQTNSENQAADSRALRVTAQDHEPGEPVPVH